MVKIFQETFNEIDKNIFKVMKIGIRYSFILTFISCFILLTYDYILKLPNLYYSGLILFKTSLFFLVDFIVCGFATDKIKKQLT